MLTGFILVIALPCIVAGAVAGYIPQPVFDARPRMRQAQAAPEPTAGTIGEAVRFKQQGKGGKRR